MTDDGIDNIVLQQLRGIRSVVDRLGERGEETMARLGHLEHGLAQTSLQLADINIRIDNVGRQLRTGSRRGSA